MTLSRRQRFQAGAIAAVGTPIVEALGGTYVWLETGTEELSRVMRSGRPPIFAFWHGRILAATLYFRDRGIIVMTSQNFDGEWIARIIRRFGYGTARGSTSRNAVRALVQLKRDVDSGQPAAFTVDGPRGPARVAQPGAIWLASATGNPIVPFHIEASDFWTVRSWDRHQVPKPGSRVAIAIGPAIEIPARADQAAIDQGREALEATLGDLEARARRLLTAH